mmetsp:Transcript_62199/g.74850  ORF Transcript_62199/g.74850 Transcript_62199/m.74850 type:complete len:136 (+) Transcript_62199:193-600(+)
MPVAVTNVEQNISNKWLAQAWLVGFIIISQNNMNEITVRTTKRVIIIVATGLLFDALLEKEGGDEGVDGEEFSASPPMLGKGSVEEEEEHPTALIDLIYRLTLPPAPSPQIAINSISWRVSMSGQTSGSLAQVIF